MPKDLTVVLENRPGTLAEVGETLGKAGVNIEGTAGIPCGSDTEIHILVEDVTAARKALEGAGIKVTKETEVLVLDVEDKAGVLGETARRIAKAGVNIDLIYIASNTRLVLGVSDINKAKGAI